MSEQPGFFRRRPLRRALANWLERHQHPFNRGIHFLGIPLAIAGVFLFVCWPWDEWFWGLAVRKLPCAPQQVRNVGGTTVLLRTPISAGAARWRHRANRASV